MIVLGDPRFFYFPIWDTTSDDVFAYRCTPLWTGKRGQLEALDLSGVEHAGAAEVLSVDLAALDRAIEHVSRIVAQYGVVKVIIPVHSSTLIDHDTRDQYLSACSSRVWAVFDNVCFEIVSTRSTSTLENLRAAFTAIRPYGSETLVCLEVNNLEWVSQPDARSILVGRDVRMSESDDRLSTELKELADLACRSGLRSFVHGITSAAMTATAIGLGFTYIGSDVLVPSVEEPEPKGPEVDDMSRTLRALMKANRAK